MARHELQRFYGGWSPSRPDHRDLRADVSGLTIKTEVDPRARMQKPDDQLKLGSCTANAVQAAVRYDRILDGIDVGNLSRIYIYYRERDLEGSLGQGDTGAYGRDGFKAMQKWGAPLETTDPYVIEAFDAIPSPAEDSEAAAHKLVKPYKAVQPSILALKRVLSNDQTIAFGMSVYESFESDDVIKSGIVPMPAASESSVGGHETLIVGYLERYPDHCLVRNSWGTDIYLDLAGADKVGGGYFLAPWEMVCSPDIAGDWRTITRPVAS